MKTILSLTFVFVLGFPLVPRVAEASAYDIVCEFKYKIGDGSWVSDTSQGTTKAIAKARRRNSLRLKEDKAKAAGLNFQAIYMFCRDPWGNSSGSD